MLHNMNIQDYFNLKDDLSSREETIERISGGATFKGASLWILICAIFIASLGLNVNSTAVIIGAMLISPLMGPIIAMGLAVGIRDLVLLRRAFKNYLVATGISIATATIYFMLSPYHEAQSELLARTSPTLYDVLIAFVGGVAGVIALSIKDKGNVIPGVAIATALMPPLCTAGFGIASGNLAYFAGAFFLYFINTVFIASATWIGVHFMKFPPRTFDNDHRAIIVQRWIIGIVVVTMIPAAFMTWNIVKESYFKTQVNMFVHDRLRWDGSQVVTSNVGADSTLRVVVVGKTLSDSAIAVAKHSMIAYPALTGYKLKLIQGSVSDSLRAIAGLQTADTGSDKVQLLEKQTQENAALSRQLDQYTRYERLSRQMCSEVHILFPEVNTLSMSATLEVSADTVKPQRVIMAVVGTTRRLPDASKEKLKTWMENRIGKTVSGSPAATGVSLKVIYQ
uniref:TIGR00341 family protein n=1 Tax=Prevotella sp. GTC17260 TaxID=3236796 RepID=A0AB33JDV8_9BACT